MSDSSENQEPHFSQEELRFLKTNYNKAKDLLEKINNLSSKYESTSLILKNHEEEIDKIFNGAKEKFNSIDNSKEESSKGVLEIKNHLEKVQIDISHLEDSLKNFESIKAKIEAKDGEINTLALTTVDLKQDIENTKSSAQQRLQDIEKIFSQIQENLTTIQEAYNTFVSLNAKFSDGETGLDAILNQASELQKRTKEILQEIVSFRDESRAHLDQIQINKNVSDDLRSQIQKNLELTIQDREQVADITALITDTGFANAFQGREKKLFYGSLVWLGVLIGSVVTLTILLYHFFGNAETIPGAEIILYRLSLTSPLILLIAFAITQYRNDRNLTERYAFKAVIAAVIRNHTKFLTDLNNNASPETVLFAKQTIENIYKEPYLKELKYKKPDKKKSQKPNLKETVDLIKELKEVIPDNASLLSVITLLVKLRQ